jgi:hypothetical protein
MNTQSTSTGSLSPMKRRLLSLLLAKKGIRLGELQTVWPRGNDLPCRLSFAQERIWFFEELEPGTAAYNVPAAVRLTGALNLEALRQSLAEILRRHETLRTIFQPTERGPVQTLGPPVQLPLSLFDMRGVCRVESEAQLTTRIRREIERPFCLSVGPLLRWCVWRLDEDEYIALLVTHHIASDGWSIHLLFGEIAALYEAFSEGRPSPLPELPIQYSDFAHWQREWFRGEVLESHLDYWKKQLGHAPADVGFPTDRPRPATRTFGGARHRVVLSPALVDSLKQLSLQEDVTLFMLMLAAFKTLLYRCTWQEDVVVGSPIANRNRAETEGLIGFFVNTLVLRTNLGGNPEFRELLARTREAALGAYAHQDMPFDKLVDALQSKRDTSRHPLFQVFFALNNNPAPEFRISGVTITPLNIDNGVAKFDLEISLMESDEGLGVTAIYNTDLFDRPTIELIIARYERLLREIVANPSARLLDYALDEGEYTPSEPADVFLGMEEFAFEEFA